MKKSKTAPASPTVLPMNEAIVAFQQSAHAANMAFGCMDVAAGDPAKLDEARTLFWQASEEMDEAAKVLAASVFVANEGQRAAIRRARMMAQFVMPPMEAVAEPDVN